MSNGDALLASAKSRVDADGQLLTVQREPTAQGGSVTTRTVGFIPQPQQNGGQTMSIEGGAMAGDPNQHDFMTAGDSDVKQNDLILAYDGNDWRVENITGSPIGGVRPWAHCWSVREKVSA